jgi:quercetin dioxygenase-like cupin family protein
LSAEEIACPDLNAALAEWRGKGFRLDSIYPADEPHTARLSREGARVRLTTRPGEPALTGSIPDFRPQFVFTKAAGAGGEGRAGMSYRDLIPGRLGGRYIASHIRIAAGGPVDDWVHYHGVALQMIYVASGWVRVVYEDQGDPFVMHAGDLVLQPPYIRHRVLESSAGLEVIEIGCPALHETFSDHALELPNGTASRLFAGQHFLHHEAGRTPWTVFDGGEAQEAAMREATGGLADVRTIRPNGSPSIHFPAHDGELGFGFVVSGSARFENGDGQPVAAADAFVVPPGEPWSLSGCSSDLRLLHVTTAHMPAQVSARP